MRGFLGTGENKSRGCTISDVHICLCKNTIAPAIPTGRGSHFSVPAAALTHRTTKCSLTGPELTEQVLLDRYGVITGGNLASSNTKLLFFHFLLFPFLLTVFPSLFLVPFPGFPGLILDQPGAQGHPGHCSAVYSLPLHGRLFLSSSHAERNRSPKVVYLGYSLESPGKLMLSPHPPPNLTD